MQRFVLKFNTAGGQRRHMMLRQTESLFIADEPRKGGSEQAHNLFLHSCTTRVECECHLNLETRSCRHNGWCHFCSSTSLQPWAERALNSKFRSPCSKGATRGISRAGPLQTQPLNSSQSTLLRVWKRPPVQISANQ